jgi:hypothetical protein
MRLVKQLWNLTYHPYVTLTIGLTSVVVGVAADAAVLMVIGGICTGIGLSNLVRG